MLAPTLSETEHSSARLDSLRKAIRSNRVSFPAQVPVFACQNRVDIQWRLVELYFVHGWSAAQLGRRHKVSSRRVHQLLRQWVSRAKVLGFLQAIPTEKECQVPAMALSHAVRDFDYPALPIMPLPGLAEAARAVAAQLG